MSGTRSSKRPAACTSQAPDRTTRLASTPATAHRASACGRRATHDAATASASASSVRAAPARNWTVAAKRANAPGPRYSPRTSAFRRSFVAWQSARPTAPPPSNTRQRRTTGSPAARSPGRSTTSPQTMPPTASESPSSMAPPRRLSKKSAKPCMRLRCRRHGEPSHVLRNVPVGGEHLVAEPVGAGGERRERDRHLARRRARRHLEITGDALRVDQRDLRQPLLDAGVEIERHRRSGIRAQRRAVERRLGEDRVGQHLRRHDRQRKARAPPAHGANNYDADRRSARTGGRGHDPVRTVGGRLPGGGIVAIKPWDSRLARLLVLPLRRTPIHPNVLTTLGLLTGLAAAGSYARGVP